MKPGQNLPIPVVFYPHKANIHQYSSIITTPSRILSRFLKIKTGHYKILLYNSIKSHNNLIISILKYTSYIKIFNDSGIYQYSHHSNASSVILGCHSKIRDRNNIIPKYIEHQFFFLYKNNPCRDIRQKIRDTRYAADST